MIPISVCIIAKNEERNIEACLRSIRKHPFETIVFDTGSTDKTVELAKKLADQVHHIDWEDDFSIARNTAAELASNNWILVIDCDETIDQIDFKAISKLIEKNPRSIGQLKRENISFDEQKNEVHTSEMIARLYDKTRYHFTGKSDEKLVSDTSYDPSYFQIPVTILHTGFWNKSEDEDENFKRNLKRLQSEINSNSADPYLCYQIGNHYMKEEDFESAYTYFNQGLNLKLDASQDYVQHMVLDYGYCLLNTNRTEQAMALANVYNLYSSNADYLFLMGLIYAKARLTDKAILEFLKATSVKKYFQEGVNSFLAYYQLGLLFEKDEQIEEAKKYFKKALPYELAAEKLTELE